VQCVDKT